MKSKPVNLKALFNDEPVHERTVRLLTPEETIRRELSQEKRHVKFTTDITTDATNDITTDY